MWTEKNGVMYWDGCLQSRDFLINGASIKSKWTISGTSIYYDAGKVGIGTTTPNYALDVNGQGMFSYAGANPLTIYRAGSTNIPYKAMNGDGYWAFGKSSSGFFSIQADGLDLNTNPKLVITTTGNVLIGTTTNDGVNKLQVSGSISATGGTSTIWNEKGYVITIPHSKFTGALADETNYVFGGGVAPEVSGGASEYMRVYIPKSGTIKAAYVNTYAETAGSNEEWSIIIEAGGTSEYVGTISAATNLRVFNSTSLNIPVTQGSYLSFSFDTPAWATNPADVHFTATIFIQD